MIIVSDNTATDIVLDLIGGPAAVDQTLLDLGVSDLRVQHRTRDLLWAVFPADSLALTGAEIARYVREHALPRHDDRIAPDAATNTGTAAALNTLLGLIARGACASAESTAAMLTILKRQTYNQRLPSTWPEEVAFAHKTGTLGAMRGDCGIMVLPDREVAISALIEAVNLPLPLTPAQEAAGDTLLAQIGAAVWRHIA
jgi:beta-lactamase class A